MALPAERLAGGSSTTRLVSTRRASPDRAWREGRGIDAGYVVTVGLSAIGTDDSRCLVRMPQAQAAGVTDRLWEIEDLVGLLD